MTFKAKITMPKIAKVAVAMPGKPKAPRHTVARPRLHRAKMQGLGKSAYAPPGAKHAFNDPEAMSAPDQAFSPGLMGAAAGGTPAGGGPPGGGMPQAGAAEPGEPDEGAAPGM